MKTVLLILLFGCASCLDVVKIDNTIYGVIHILDGGLSIDGKVKISEDVIIKVVSDGYKSKIINNALAFEFSKQTSVEDATRLANSLIMKINPVADTYFYAGRLGVSSDESNKFARMVAGVHK